MIKGQSGPLRWNESSSETFTAHGHPKLTDTDDDGIRDDIEKLELHTDPSSDDTYLIIEQQQLEIVQRFYELYQDPSVDNDKLWESANTSWIYFGLRNNPHVETDINSLEDFDDVILTDASTDFDFVRADDGDIVYRSYADGQTASVNRPDTWLAFPGELLAKTDHWDPDSDDGGLTDGQEVRGVTRSDTGGFFGFFEDTGLLGLKPDKENTFITDPLDPDTDGDGYWDG